MTVQLNSNGVAILFTWGQDSQIEDYIFDLSGRRYFQLSIRTMSALSGAVHIAGSQIEFTSDNAPFAPTFVYGDATVSGGVVTPTPGISNGYVNVVFSEPPNILRMAYSAATFPTSATGPFVTASVAWK